MTGLQFRGEKTKQGDMSDTLGQQPDWNAQWAKLKQFSIIKIYFLPADNDKCIGWLLWRGCETKICNWKERESSSNAICQQIF